MGSSRGFTKVLAIMLAIALATVVAGAGVAGASAPRAASPEAKEACKKLKKKIKGKKGEAKAKAKAKYKKCLKEYDDGVGDEIDGGETGGGGEVDPPDPTAAALALIENQEFYRPFAGTYSGGDELIRFCSGGTYFRRYTSSSDVGVTEYLNNGTWKMNQAAGGTTAEGVPGYAASLTITGTWDDSPPVTGNIAIAVSEQTQQSAIDIGSGPKEFVRRDLTGTC